MKFKKTKTCFLIIWGLNIALSQAQDATIAAGGEATGNGGTTSYSIGQVAYSSNFVTNNSVTEGVQQPYEISEVTGSKEYINASFSIELYPNPTTDFIQLKVNSENYESLSFQLFDLTGKLIENEKVIDIETNIDMSQLAPANYLLKILKDNNEVKTYNIVKTR